MTIPYYTDERRWARFDLSESRSRIYHHKKTGYEIVFGAYIYCLKAGDEAAALFLKERLIELRSNNDADPFPLKSPALQSLSEAQIQREEAEFIISEETKAVLEKVA